MTRGERIYAIFKTLHSNLNEPLIDRWKKVFNTNNLFDVYFFLERLYNEINIYEEELKTLNVPQKIYEPVIKQLKALIVNYNFSNRLSNLAIDKEFLERFYGFSFYGKNEEITKIDLSEEIKIMQNSLQEIKNNELKLILEDIVSSINRLQTLPKITGKIALEDSFKEIFCKTKINIDELQKAPKPFKEALIKAYTKIDNALSFAEKWISRGENLVKLIENLGG